VRGSLPGSDGSRGRQLRGRAVCLSPRSFGEQRLVRRTGSNEAVVGHSAQCTPRMRANTNRTTPIGHTQTRSARPEKAHAGVSKHRTRPASQKGWFATLMPTLPWPNTGAAIGSLDGDGAGDHDQPYRFGFRPRASAPYPFNTRQYSRLLVLRSRVQNDVGAASELARCHGSAPGVQRPA
jgi:hypothetical protein